MNHSIHIHIKINRHTHHQTPTLSLTTPHPPIVCKIMHISPSEDRLSDPKLPGSRALHSSMLVNNGSPKCIQRMGMERYEKRVRRVEEVGQSSPAVEYGKCGDGDG